MRFALVILVVAAILVPTAVAQNSTSQNTSTVTPIKGPPKDRGTPSSSEMTITFSSPSSASFLQDQTWEANRADEFRQSLDAYFGNGDGRVTAEEAAKLINATESEMLNKTFPFVGVDGTAGTVVSVTVTLDGVVDAANGTPASLHHNASLSFPPTSGDTHAIAVTPLWDGTITIVAPAGMVVSAGDQATGQSTLSVQGTSKTTQTFTLSPAPPPTPTAQPTVQPTASTTTTAPTVTTPQESSGPAPRSKIPDIGLIGVSVAVLAVALLARTRGRR